MPTKRKSSRSIQSESDEVDVASSVINDDYYGSDVPPDEPVAKVVLSRSGALFLPIAVKRLPEEQMEVLADLQHLALGRQQLLIQLEEVIGAARQMGLSWNVIGWSVGMSGQAARKRWIELDENR